MRFLMLLFIFLNALTFISCQNQKDNHVVTKHFDAKLAYDGEVLQVDTKMQGSRIYFNLPKVLRKGEATNISISHKIKFDFRREGAYDLFPVTYFTVLVTSTMEVTCPEKYFIATAGNLTRLTGRNGGKRYLYTNDIPCTHSGIFIGAGFDYHTLESGSRQFDLYIIPAEQKEHHSKLLEMMQEAYYLWEDMMGPLPYTRISLVVSDGFRRSVAMHSIITVNNATLFPDKNIYGFMTHEIGHLWWGNMICEGVDSNNHYLVESLVEYFTLIFIEDKYDKNEIKNGFRSFSKYLSENKVTEELIRDSSPVCFQRAISAFNMLHHIIGRENMYKLVRNLYEKHAFSLVSNKDFQRSAEETYGKDLSWFFDGFYRSKSKYDIALADVRTSGDSPSYRTEFRIYEKYGEIRNPSDVEVAIRTENEILIRKINGTDSKGKQININTNSKVLSITVDPDYKIMDWNRANNSTAWVITDYQWHPRRKGIFIHRADGKIFYCEGTDNKIIAENILSSGYKRSFVPSPDGDRIAYTVSKDRGSELWITDINSEKSVRLTKGKTKVYNPGWGDKGVIFGVTQKAKDSPVKHNIWRWTAEKGANPLFKANNSNNYRSPVTSPDGKKLAFKLTRDNKHELWFSDISGDNQQLLIQRPYIGTPVWDSEEKRVAFACSASTYEKREICMIDTDIGTQSFKQLTKSEKPGINDWNPVWSSDGSVFFVSDRNKNVDIYKISPDHREIQLTDGPADEYHIRYNHVTDQIAYLCNETEPPELRIMDSDGKNKQSLSFCNNQNLMVAE